MLLRTTAHDPFVLPQWPHANGAFHVNPDTRPQALRFRIGTPSLRGMFNQQIQSSKRALRTVEDFAEFEQHTAYSDGDQVTAAKKGPNALDRGTISTSAGSTNPNSSPANTTRPSAP
jgi:hypothetical protein